MFYGVINESYDYTKYLEMELENSLLFFKSLDVVQESGIQVVQEGVWSTIKEKISELWTKFKNWVKGIWEKIKGLFTKKKSTIEKIRETNKKIKSSKGKVNESFSYIKEDSEESDSKEIKWYTTNQKEIDKSFDDFFGLELYRAIDPNTMNNEEKVNKVLSITEELKNKLSNYDFNSLFVENTFNLGNIPLDQLRLKAEEISIHSEKLADYNDLFIDIKRDIEKDISNTEKELDNIAKSNTDGNIEFIVINGGRDKIPTNVFSKITSSTIIGMKNVVSFLIKCMMEISDRMGDNLDAITQIYNYLQRNIA